MHKVSGLYFVLWPLYVAATASLSGLPPEGFEAKGLAIWAARILEEVGCRVGIIHPIKDAEKIRKNVVDFNDWD